MRADQTTAAPASAAEPQPAFTIVKRKTSSWWEVRDPEGELVSTAAARERCVPALAR
jgi:hypothetical protein